MKRILYSLVATMLFIGNSLAQTNSTPIVISFTNSFGDYITNAQVVSWNANKLIYRCPGGGGTIRLDKLPQDLQIRFNYDPAKAAKADQADQIQKENYQRYLAAQEKAQELDLQKKILIQKSRTISGRILQKLPGGLLVESGQEEIDQVGHTDVEYDEMRTVTSRTVSVREGNTPGAECLGLVFLEDHPRYAQLVDDNVVVILAYPDGQYTYTSVAGGQKTVRRFTADFEKALNYQLTNSR
jgi:hypothetical protein